MKLFRKLTVLALAVLLVCALSAAAFATGSFSDPQIYDGSDSILYVYATVNDTSSSATMDLETVGLNSSYMRIEGTYNYFAVEGTQLVHRPSPYPPKVVTTYNEYSCNGGIPEGRPNGFIMLSSAEYSFYAELSTWSGDHTYTRNVSVTNYTD